MRNNEHHVTIQDVAREAGVSITTVSRVINNNYPVKPETRERVQKTIEKLNFNPNILARSLIIRKTNTIGVVVPSAANMFFMMVVEGIEKSCRRQNITVLLSLSEGDGEREIECVNNLVSRQVDGIIVADPVTDNIEKGCYEDIVKQIPVVFINGYDKQKGVSYILNDEAEGTELALKYLMNLGHNKIAFIRGSKSYSYDIKENVYKKFEEEYKNILKKPVILNIGDGNSVETVDNTSDIVYSLLKSEDCPTAFLACNDLMGVGVLNACSRAKKAVPKDISVIGFDNITISQLSEPKLTTVDQNMNELGGIAAQILIENISGEGRTGIKRILKTNLVIRDSCGSPQ